MNENLRDKKPSQGNYAEAMQLQKSNINDIAEYVMRLHQLEVRVSVFAQLLETERRENARLITRLQQERCKTTSQEFQIKELTRKLNENVFLLTQAKDKLSKLNEEDLIIQINQMRNERIRLQKTS